MITKYGIKSILTIFVFAAFFMLACVRTHAQVLDYANLFNENEEKEIESLSEEVKKHIHMDVVILTTDDARGFETKYFADEVYNGMMGKEYGFGKDHSGFIFTIDMDNREIYIQGYGKAILYLTDDAAENIIDIIYSDIVSEEYAVSAVKTLNEVRYLYDRGIQKNQYTFDAATGEIVRYKSIGFFEGIISTVIAFFTSFSFFAGIRKSHKQNAEDSRNMAYNLGFANATMQQVISEGDELIHRNQYTRTIPSHNVRSGRGGGSKGGGRSTIYRGSSGRGFSGSGRKF